MIKIITILFTYFLSFNLTFAEEIKYKPWVYDNTKISEKCLNNLYPVASGDWYESYYDNYINKLVGNHTNSTN